MNKRIFLICTWMLSSAFAQDLLSVDPKRTRLLIDNEQVRALELELEPGGQVATHSHPETLTYAFSDAHLKITLPDGAAKEINVQAGAAVWNDPETHRIENIGTKPLRALIFELKPASHGNGPAKVISHKEPKTLPWKDAPRGFPPGLRIALLDGDIHRKGPFMLRMFYPAGLWIAPHRNTSNEGITVISGKIHVGLTQRGERTQTTAYGPGGYLMIPAGQAHYIWAEEDTEVQVHGQGPWRVIFLQTGQPEKGEKQRAQ